MMRWISALFFFTFSTAGWAQDLVFTGRVDLGRDIASFESSPPVAGTLYVFSGSAATVRIVSEEPFLAEVEFVQADWVDDANLVPHRVLLRFQGDVWAKRVVVRKPRQGGDEQIYPYRKFQVAAKPVAGAFDVFAVTALY